MRFTEFKTDYFAGLRDIEIKFEPGLNVVLGANEAGKSTVVDAVYASLFKSSKLRMNLKEDIDFKKRYLPLDKGDYINALTSFNYEGKQYTVKKEWGNENSSQLLEAGGKKMVEESSIQDKIFDIFSFGKKTAKNIIFTGQENMKSIIEEIKENPEVKNTLNGFLRRAVMELDGVSVEKFRNRVLNSLDDFTKRWNLSEKRPENPNRGVDNPYLIGCGKIYDKFIEKGLKKREMEQAFEVEEKYFELAEDLKKLEKRKEKLSKKINFLSEKEDDIYRRGIIEAKLEAKNEKIEELKEVNKRWPAVFVKMENNEKKLSDAEKKIKQLKNEKEKAKNKKHLEEKVKTKKKIDKIDRDIIELKKKINDLSVVDKGDIDRVRHLKERLIEDKASLEASTWKAKIIKAEKDVTITSGLNDKKVFKKGESFDVEAYLKIELDDSFIIEVQSQNLDFEMLKKRCEKNIEERISILDKYNAESLEELRTFSEDRNSLKSELKIKLENRQDLLDDQSIEVIENSVEKINNFKNIRELSEIEKELEDMLIEKSDLSSTVSSLKSKINDWEEKYISHDHIFDKIIELKSELTKLEEEESELAKLPEEYNSISEFKTDLNNLRKKKDNNDRLYQEKNIEYVNTKNQLVDKSYEELKKEYSQIEEEFKKSIKKAENLTKVKKVMEEKLKEFDQKSFRPLIESFSYYIKEITGSKYNVVSFDEKYRIELSSSVRKLPVEKKFLSFGTYDSIALALKFSLIEQIYSDNRGFFVLDDPLVNLDPERKKNTIKIISDLAEKYQIVLTTCSPFTAEKIGGNIIEI